MDITEETRLSNLLGQYPWLKEELSNVNDKFRMLNTPMGKIMMGKATIAEMSKRSGMDTDVIIGKISKLIETH
ncbi:MAG: DUF1858 domain-containing protein [Ruminococcaceae bacterium]|nr:DUF1858 domain-containing protein [Oscillospiraceae bacterium]